MAETHTLPHPLVVGDIGGTNARFAWADAPGDPVRIVARLRTSDYAGPAEAIRHVAGSVGATPRSVVLCGAGPVDGRRCQLTNAGWLIDGAALAAELGLSGGLLLNDFEAQALALPALPADSLLTIGTERRAGPGPRLVLGPGTGLGVGALLEVDGRFIPLASEGGHVDLAPFTAEEQAVFAAVERVGGRLAGEVVLSGPGLARLHAARCRVAGVPNGATDGAAVVNAALADPRSAEADTVRMFLTLLARFAGDMAIAFCATGGVFIAGGIVPRLVPLLDHAAFRATFEAKEPVRWLPESIATRLIVSPDAVLHGMAAIAAAPGRYAIDYASRGWKA
ncbi:glucokinase [Alsobacter sp. R-9]